MKVALFFAVIGVSTVMTAVLGIYVFMLEGLGVLNMSIGSTPLGFFSIGESAYVLAIAVWGFFFVINCLWAIAWRYYA